MPGASKEATRPRRDIQGLRAIAVLLVAFNHAGVGFLKGGYVGVDVFFVLSGYLITGVLTRSTASLDGRRTFFSSFYARRARRILPAATLTLLAVEVASVNILNLVQAHAVLNDSVWAAFFAANFHFAAIGTNYFAAQQAPSPLQHFWSLAVEEQFYVVWPLLIAVILLGRKAILPARRREPTARRLTALTIVAGVLTAVSFGYAVYFTHVNSTAAYFSTPARAWELGLGALLALTVDRLRPIPTWIRVSLGWLGIAAILFAGWRYSSATTFPGIAALLPDLGAAALLLAEAVPTGSHASVARVLELAPMRFIGDRSYTFYLWHWPVLILAMDNAGHTLSTTTNLALLGGAFGLSIVSYGLFENPVRHMRRITRPVALAFWPTAFIVVFCFASWHKSDLVDAQNLAYTPPAHVRSIKTTVVKRHRGRKTGSSYNTASPAVVSTSARAATRNARVPSDLNPSPLDLGSALYALPSRCYATTGQTSSQICSFGDTASSKRMVVFGDSHAQMWMPAIIDYADAAGYDIRLILKHSCNPFRWAGAGRVGECAKWYGWAVGQLKAQHPSLVLLVAHWNVSSLEADVETADPESNANIARFLQSVHSTHAKVAVLGDPPGQTIEPANCLLKAGATMSQCSRVEPYEQIAETASVAEIAHTDKAAFFDTTPWLCDHHLDVCPMVIGHTVAYVDHDHITSVYAQALGQLFSTTLTQALKAPK